MSTGSPQIKGPIPGMDVCPYLGISEDEQTCLGYPSPGNYCHHCRPAMAVRLSHQRSRCLVPAFTECPVFQCHTLSPLPAKLRDRLQRPGGAS